MISSTENQSKEQDQYFMLRFKKSELIIDLVNGAKWVSLKLTNPKN